MLKPKYEFISDYQNGLAKIKIDGKYGLIDENINIVYAPKWKSVEDFHNGYAVVVADNGKAGIINANGEIVLKPLYYDAIDSVNSSLLTRAENFKDHKNVLIDVYGNIKKEK